MEEWVKYLKEKGVFDNIILSDTQTNSDVVDEIECEDDEDSNTSIIISDDESVPDLEVLSTAGVEDGELEPISRAETEAEKIISFPTSLDGFCDQEKSEPKPKTKVFRPVITAPVIDFATDSHKFINAARRLYGVKESVNFSEEYEKYVSERRHPKQKKASGSNSTQSEANVTSNRRKRSAAGTSESKTSANPYARAFIAPITKRRSIPESSNEPVVLALDYDKKLPEVKSNRSRSGRKRKKNSNTRFDKTVEFNSPRFQQIRKSKPDEYVLESHPQYKFKCIPSLDGDDDEWEDIIGKAKDMGEEVVKSKTDVATMTEDLALRNDQAEAEKIKRKASQIVERHAKSAVLRENGVRTMPPRQEQDFIPTRITTKTRFHPPGPKNEDKEGEGMEVERDEFDELQLQSKFRNLRTNDANTGTEDEDPNLSFLESEGSLIFDDEEVRTALNESEPEEIMSTNSKIDENPECVVDALLEKTTEFYTDEELMAMRPADTDIQSHLQSSLLNGPGVPNSDAALPIHGYQIKYKEWEGKSPYSKYKVRKYKVVTANDMVREFVHVTFPTMRRTRLRPSNAFREERFQATPVPKCHSNFLLQAEAYNIQTKNIVCEKLQIPGYQFDKIMEEISPRVGKSYHDVQVESVLKNGPEVCLPSSFPYSYCERSCTLSLLRDSIHLFNDMVEGKETPRAKMGDMIHPATLNTVPEDYSNLDLKGQHYPMSMGARFLDRPIDMVFTVAIYAPARVRGDVRFSKKAIRDDTKVALRSKIEVLGSQSLADIRDMFLCISDCYDTQETHKLPGKLTPVEPNRLTKTISPRYVFLVEDKILVDYTNTESFNAMKRIKSWFQEKQGKEIECNDSTNTKISDLKISFGQTYLFIHQENCQHIFQFEGARVCRPNEADAPNSFPRFIFKRDLLVKCHVDKTKLARWRIIGFDLMPEDPMLLCTNCVKKVCFDKDGNKRGAFQMYQFDPSV